MEVTVEGIEKFATILFPSRFIGRRLLLMLAAYLDESGTHSDSPIISVAGFLSTQARWIEYEPKWTNALAKWGLAEFHMTDFENWQPPYDKLSKTEHIELIGSLIDVIRATAWVGVAAALVKRDFIEVCASENVSLGSEYSFCANTCIRLLRQWMDTKQIPERIVYVFALGAEGASDIHKAFEKAHAENADRLHLQSLHFSTPDQYTQLQAADILAHESIKQAARVLGYDDRALRKSLERILKGVPVESSLLHADAIRRNVIALREEWARLHP